MISARLLGCPRCGWARGLRASRLSTADCIVARCPCGGWEVHGGHSLGTHSVPPVEHRWLDGDQIDHTAGAPMPARWMVRTERRAGEMTKIDLLRGSFGCADSTGHVAVDPYRREVAAGAQWHDCARGDGGSYSGVVETLERAEGESEQAFEARAFGRAREIDERQRCSRCS